MLDVDLVSCLHSFHDHILTTRVHMDMRWSMMKDWIIKDLHLDLHLHLDFDFDFDFELL